jgi:hypothetical protein
MEYNTQTAEQLRDQFGFAGIQVLPDFITADEEINLLNCLDQVDRRLHLLVFALESFNNLMIVKFILTDANSKNEVTVIYKGP